MLTSSFVAQGPHRSDMGDQSLASREAMIQARDANLSMFARATEGLKRDQIKHEIGNMNSNIERGIYNIESKQAISNLSSKFQLISKIASSIN
ncbi:hypothetical protein [Martelella mediterranea]|uniref:Uncharacterized protein n=1 Tax=Martelella mediterranea TaxID=293089 RepID=A0A4R3NFD8_9HYPH|nr:hypothetical protein [Martelella mediterranea]TCT29256.1 hypothetical protein EDC90_10523 [Martelella mediterranea]